MLRYLVTEKHHYTVTDYLEQEWGRRLRDRMVVAFYRTLRTLDPLPRGCYIFSDLDRLGPKARSRAVEAWNHLRDSGLGTRLLNNPALVPGRRELLRRLHECGTNDFRAFRADADGKARFPVFVREAVEHSGSRTPLIKTRESLERAKKWLVGEGYRLRDLLVVEFCSTKDETGLVRKYSAFNVGGEIIPRYLTVSDTWMVKYHAMIVNEGTAREELEYMHTNPHRDALAGIFRMAGVDYGRIDYGLLNGKPQIWEINVNPSIGAPRRGEPPSEERKRQVALRLEFTTLFYEKFGRALETLVQ